ncbi:MAG TPA: SDR family oxidoreductase [Actinomycetes bacterium]|nr:SDR family oxidoreductase [Actinomycetes bacterium]
MTTLYAVTGATGQLGGHVARLLALAGAEQRLIVRDPTRAPRLQGASVAEASYDDLPALTSALTGIDTLFLVSAEESKNRVDVHRRAIDAAASAGVSRIVYTSFLAASADCTFTFGRDHFHSEQHIIARGIQHTFLRDSLYLDFVAQLVGADGVIRGPGGDGRVAGVAREDVARVAAAVMLDDTSAHVGATYDLTGPDTFNLTEAAEVLTTVTGHATTYVEETIEEAYQSRAGFGAEPWEVDGWVSTYVSLAKGELDVVSGDVEQITGERPMTLQEFLANQEPSTN